MAQLEAKEIGRRIAQARTIAGLTQDEVGELASFSKRSLQDYEAGVTIPFRHMREISRLLDRPVEWFLHGRDDETEQRETAELIAGLGLRLATLEASVAHGFETLQGSLGALQRSLDALAALVAERVGQQPRAADSK